MKEAMTSLQRVTTALGHREPDRVPYFLLLTMHGAKELGLSIKEYFSKAENVVEGQLRLRAKYGHDCINPSFYAAAEVEAWGGEVVFHDDGPPNAGAPLIRDPADIQRLVPPAPESAPCLRKVLDAIAQLKARVGDDAPIMGGIISPFSLPVMQMGFEAYLRLIHEQPALFDRLMRVNEEFSVAWANAQLKAGAAAIGYADPVSSPTIIPRTLYLKTGFEVAKRTIARIHGSTATGLASGRTLSIIDDLVRTGTKGVIASVLEDLAVVKAACRGRLALIGNLNAIEMCRWTQAEAEAAVRTAIAKAGPGGGFVLADNHGEIPWQVPDETLRAVAAAAREWGRYPLAGVKSHAR